MSRVEGTASSGLFRRDELIGFVRISDQGFLNCYGFSELIIGRGSWNFPVCLGVYIGYRV